MKRVSTDLLIGGAIVAVGLIILLQNLGLFGPVEDVIWATLFGAGGLVFLSVAAQSETRWWAVIPGAALLSIGALIGLTAIAPALGAAWGGTLFLGGLSMAFWSIYLMRRHDWWAIIPGGVLLTLAIVAGLNGSYAGPIAGSVFFFGLAATFGLVAIAPAEGSPRRWAFIPGGVMLALAVLTLASTPVIMDIMWPALLILFGLVLLYRAMRRPGAREERIRHEDKTVSQPH